MKLFFIPAMLFCITTGHCQFTASNNSLPNDAAGFNQVFKQGPIDAQLINGKVKLDKANRWKLSKNKLITGGLLMLSGAAKGFNETLEFNWHGFADVFPKANPKWFYPQQSFKNKYKDGDREKGAKFPLSTSVLVFLTDQYHLNNFIHRGAITSALVVKLGEGKKPFMHYVWDVLYYSVCYQAGFGGVYYYFKSRM